jgi:hypothetical protein
MRSVITVAAIGAALMLAGCGGSNASNFASSTSTTSNGGPAIDSAVNVVALSIGSNQQQITSTIQAFYRATWENDTVGACSLFSANGARGFMAAAKVAFPGSVNSATTCPEIMRTFNASIVQQVQTLQDDDVSVDGDALNQVGVADVKVSGDKATAQAPEQVGVLIAPKLFHMVYVNKRWLIDSSSNLSTPSKSKGKKTSK